MPAAIGYLRYAPVCSTVRLSSHAINSVRSYRIRPPILVNLGPLPAHLQFASVRTVTLPL